jgi:hypothetical protein
VAGVGRGAEPPAATPGKTALAHQSHALAAGPVAAGTEFRVNPRTAVPPPALRVDRCDLEAEALVGASLSAIYENGSPVKALLFILCSPRVADDNCRDARAGSGRSGAVARFHYPSIRARRRMMSSAIVDARCVEGGRPNQ